jgi:hypothetical protein
MWWQDLVLGFWNGLTAWIVLLVHVFGGWQEFPLYDVARRGNWYDFGFLLGAGSPFLGAAGKNNRAATIPRAEQRREPRAVP